MQQTLNNLKQLQIKIINNSISDASAIKEITDILKEFSNIILKKKYNSYEYKELMKYIAQIQKQIELKEISKKIELDNKRLDLENKELINLIIKSLN